MTFIVKYAPVLKEWRFCCCSCSLRAAAVVLAWFSAIAGVSKIVTCITYLSHPAIHPQTTYETKEFLIAMLSTAAGSTVVNVLLLYGIHKKKPVYMLPFLVLNLIVLVISVPIIFIAGIIAMVSNWIFGLIALVIGSALMVLAAFCWIVLYSYYRQVEEEKNHNSGIVNYTYGIPSDQVQVLPEDKKSQVLFQ